MWLLTVHRAQVASVITSDAVDEPQSAPIHIARHGGSQPALTN